jgi:hypothetical protein
MSFAGRGPCPSFVQTAVDLSMYTLYRNRRYEEDIVILMWHKEGEQRMIETGIQKTQIQAHHKITESATQTHTQKQTKDYVHGI